ncbi:histidine--tRNA ligase [Stygiolobus caldivivus]|uniref:Histidine--tRNA ligase n=2 Tax=Stygiolobus caldivivus TaxID=2824673 RepID=A0A8D5ZJP9_9CREN|nr:histidine--tRNA ligase [Stygiolobus caldivivus]
MKDYYGKELEKIKFIEDTFRKIVNSAGYSEIYTPVVEEFELFSMKGGEELRNTMYVFKDKAEREIALRPEFTPSVVRAYLNKMQHLPKPVRLFYIGTVYRYDEPQFGRFREFRQAGIELIGSNSILADIEVVDLLLQIYSSLGLSKDIEIKINNIAIYRKIFNKINLDEAKQEHILHLIDKGKREEALRELKGTLYTDLINFLLEQNQVKIDSLDTVLSEVSKYENLELTEEIDKIKAISRIISDFNIKVNIDLGFVRGLAYYTGLIFEVKHYKVPFSIAGGGRYDSLVRLYGGNDTPAIGFAIGVERTALVLDSVDKLQSPKKGVLIIISTNDNRNSSEKDMISYGIKVLHKLRELGLIVSLNLKEQSISKLIPSYLEEGYSFIVIIGKKELEEKKITIKNLENKSQLSIPENSIEEYVKQII